MNKPSISRAIKEMETNQLKPYKNNSRIHDEKQVEQISASIEKFGFTQPILIDENNIVLAGHGRLMAAQKLGLSKVPVIVLDDLSEAQKKAYVIADNKIGQNSKWNNEVLRIEIEDIAKDEQVYSARFIGKTGYVVTYKQTDPLFSIDLSDPKNPQIIGELKIPGFSEYLHPYGDGKLLGIGMDVSEDGFTTEGVKLSMFNVTDPSNVTEENKYTIEESYGTDVGYNYKGVFVDVQKNLFGFVTYHDGVTYQLYTYDEAEGFKEVMSRQLSGYEGSRGLYIGDVFYLVSGNMIESYSMNGFEKMDDIVL